MNVMKKYIRILEFLVVIIACYFPLCYRIDALPINQWDEARNAVHTVEMLQNHNYLVRTYQGVAETWEPKPPLLIWLQLASSKIFGLNELAIRFPVMIATFLTVVMLILYFARFFNNRYIGYLSVLILVTSQGYIDRHIARTGDHDALLILITTAIILHFYILMHSGERMKSQFIGIAVLFVLGVFTKSIAVFFILPGLLFSCFAFGKAKKIFTNKWFYIALLIFIIPTAAYYISREIIQPGYLDAVWQWELFPRYANTENRFDSGTFWFYSENFFKSRYTFWIWFLMAAIIFLPFMLRHTARRFSLYLLLNTLILFIILSMGSKGLWYDGPLYPLFAIMIALFLDGILSIIRNISFKNIRIRRWLIGVLSFVLVILLTFPYNSILRKVSITKEYPWAREFYAMSYFLRDERALDTLPDPLKVVFEGYNAHLLFYAESRNYEAGRDRIQLTNLSGISAGDSILISQNHVMDSIRSHFNYEIIHDDGTVKEIRICN